MQHAFGASASCFVRIPIGGPFPDIADHVVQAVAVRRERGDGRCALEAVRAKVLPRKFTLPGVRHMLSARHELIAPGKLGTVEPAARGEFPFGLGRQVLAGPFGVSQRVGERHMHDRMMVEPVDVALRAVGVAPVRALEEGPPFTPVAQIDRARRRREDERARIEHVRQRARVVLRVGRNFRERNVAGCLDEFLELPVRDWRAVHPELVDGYAMDRCFFRIVLVRSHAERAAGHERHV